MEKHQIDCFKINMMFWRFLAVWPGDNASRSYSYYSGAFIMIFVFVYFALFSLNFWFLPTHLDIFIDNLLFYFTDCYGLSQILTFLLMRNKIISILDVLESEVFQPGDTEGKAIIEKAKKFNKLYWKVVAITCVTSMSILYAPLIEHFIKGTELLFPVCGYGFFSEAYRDMFLYPLYIYQAVGLLIHMLYNLNIHTFFLGLLIFIIAQLEILDLKLRKVTDKNKLDDANSEISREPTDRNKEAVKKLNKCIIHFDEVSRFCNLVEEVFSVTLFVQFSMASCIICVCLMRFTWPASLDYLLFLGSYMIVMILQIMLPCWFGTQIMDKSNCLGFSVYNCDWTPRSRQFKSTMRIFVERTNKPLCITGCKMFCLSLPTFTSIMNYAYSFFTLLQQTQD